MRQNLGSINLNSEQCEGSLVRSDEGVEMPMQEGLHSSWTKVCMKGHWNIIRWG